MWWKRRIRVQMEKKKLNLSFWSMVLGIIGMVTACMCIGTPAAIAAIVLGAFAIKSGCSDEDRKKAIAGIVTGTIGLLIFCVMMANLGESEPSETTENTQVIAEATETVEKKVKQASELVLADTEATELVLADIEATELVEADAEASESEENLAEIKDVQTEQALEQNEDVQMQSSSQSQASQSQASQSQASTAATVNDEVAVSAPTETAPMANDDETITVHVTATGSKYHSAGCRYLSKSDYAVSLDEAKSRNLEPCSVCNPPQ